MKVIHYIADITAGNGALANNARAMLLCVSRMAECHLITTVAPSEAAVATLASQYGITVHVIAAVKGRNPLPYLAAYSNIRRTIREIQPDVVHVHGTWDPLAAFTERAARRLNIVTVVSPHGGLAPEIINIDFWKVRLPRLIAYQAMMIRQCTCVAALSDKERDDVLNTALKKRIEVVPMITKRCATNTNTNTERCATVTGEGMEKMRSAIAAIYRKALDSTYQRRITEAERDFVFQVVKAAVLEPEYLEQVPAEIPDSTGLSFRRIFFHAYDEDVMQLFLTGAQKLALTIPPALDVESVPRYRNRKAKARGSLIEAAIKVKPLRIAEENKTEHLAVTQFCKAATITMPRLTLRQWVELYRLFRNTDFDEEMVGRELKRLSRKGFIKRLQKRLKELFALPSGYYIY